MASKLNPKQERFCKLYSSDREFFGNGVETYLEVYDDIDKAKKNWYKTACVNASRLLSNAKIYTRINELLQEGGLNDNFVDKQLLFLISQQSDFANKAAAIREYNKLKQRVAEKPPVTIEFNNLTDDQLSKLIASKIGKDRTSEDVAGERETSET